MMRVLDARGQAGLVGEETGRRANACPDNDHIGPRLVSVRVAWGPRLASMRVAWGGQGW